VEWLSENDAVARVPDVTLLLALGQAIEDRVPRLVHWGEAGPARTETDWWVGRPRTGWIELRPGKVHRPRTAAMSLAWLHLAALMTAPDPLPWLGRLAESDAGLALNVLEQGPAARQRPHADTPPVAARRGAGAAAFRARTRGPRAGRDGGPPLCRLTVRRRVRRPKTPGGPDVRILGEGRIWPTTEGSTDERQNRTDPRRLRGRALRTSTGKDPMIQRNLLLCVLALVLLPEALLACSPAPGTDLDAFWARVERPPYLLGGLSAFAAGLWLVLRGRGRAPRRWAFVLTALAVFQPAWWMQPMADCGVTRDFSALLTTFLSLGVLGVALFRTRRRPVAAPASAAGASLRADR
jgi:hypothetical protein